MPRPAVLAKNTRSPGARFLQADPGTVARAELRRGAVRQALARASVGVAGQARAVEAARPRAAPAIARADELKCDTRRRAVTATGGRRRGCRRRGRLLGQRRNIFGHRYASSNRRADVDQLVGDPAHGAARRAHFVPFPVARQHLQPRPGVHFAVRVIGCSRTVSQIDVVDGNRRPGRTGSYSRRGSSYGRRGWRCYGNLPRLKE